MAEETRKPNAKEVLEEKIAASGATKKTLFAGVGIFGCLVLTVVMSITGIAFDPAVFYTWNYWTGMIIQFAISIFAMITGQQIGDDSQRNKPTGQFRRELKNYRVQREEIAETLGIISYFEAWLSVYREERLKKKIEEVLMDIGIRQKAVLDLDLSDLPHLEKPFRKDWTGTPYFEKYLDPETGKSETTFKSLSPDQIEALRMIFDGKVTIPYISASYFLDALKENGSDEWQQAAEAAKRKPQKMVSSYTYKIFSLAVVSAITNGIVAAPYDDPGSVALSIASRIFTLTTSTVWGIFLGFQIVKMDITYLSFKTYILKKFKDEFKSGRFKPETVEEQAERELREYEASVVHPEVVGESPSVPLIEAK